VTIGRAVQSRVVDRDERRFERWRSRGDLAALARVFDRVAPDLLAVASHLARDLEQAEDWVQATFLAAIEGADRWDAERPLRPWLFGILARHAARVRREEARTPDPARLPPSGVEDPARLTADAEASGALRGALAGLPRLYRDVLGAHLLEGKRPVEIAHERARAPGTVRMQIQRGLELLRRALPPGLATAFALRASPASIGRGLAALRESVLEHAAGTSAAAPAAGATAGALALGGIAVTTKTTLIGSALAVAAAGAWLAWGPRDGIARPAVDPPEIAAAPEGSAAPLAAAGPLGADGREELGRAGREAEAANARAAGPASPERPAALAEPRAAAGCWLVGRLHGLEQDEPERATINAFCLSGAAGVEPVLADEGGLFEMDLTALVHDAPLPAEVLVSVNHPRYLVGNAVVGVGAELASLDPTQRVEIPLDVVMTLAGRLAGRVELPAAAAGRLGRVQVGLFPVAGGDDEPRDPVRETEVRPDGRFEFVKRAPGRYLVVASCPGLLPAHREVELVAGETARPEPLVLGEGSASIAGAVRLPGELAGVRVRAELADAVEEPWSWNGVGWGGGGPFPRAQEARCAADGTFTVEGLRPGRYRLVLDGATAFVAPAPAFAAAPSEGVVLGASLALVRLRVRVDGAPEEGAWISFARPADDAAVVLDSDADGERLVYLDGGTPWRVDVRARGCEPWSLDLAPAGPGGETVLDVELVHGSERFATLVLEPWSADGRPIGAVDARLEPQEEGVEHIETRLEPIDGRFVLADLPPATYDVRLEPADDAFGPRYSSFERWSSLEVRLGAGDRVTRRVELAEGGRLRVTAEPATDGFARFELVDDAGVSWDVRFVSQVYADNVVTSSTSQGALPLVRAADGYPNLPPGRYALRVVPDEGYRPIETSFVIVPGRTTDVTLHLRHGVR